MSDSSKSRNRLPAFIAWFGLLIVAMLVASPVAASDPATSELAAGSDEYPAMMGEWRPPVAYPGRPLGDIDGDLERLSDPAEVTCGPRFNRYPVAGPHNHGYDSSWNTFTCNGTLSNSDWSGHYGNDIFAPRHTPVVAAQAGTITLNFWNSAGGNVVYIVDDCGWWHYYAHLEERDPGLSIGQRVDVGARLGTIGNSGNAIGTEPHLHYSVFPDDQYYQGVDPHGYLAGLQGGSCQSGNACSCLNGINVDWLRIPVTDTDCGHRVCGVSTELFQCNGQQWSRIGSAGSCGSSCSCPGGKFKNGRDIPAHMTHCGYRVCGMSSTFWDCTSGGWSNTQIPCS